MTIHCDHSRICSVSIASKPLAFSRTPPTHLPLLTASSRANCLRVITSTPANMRDTSTCILHASHFHLYFAEAGYTSQHSSAVGAYQGRSQPLSLATHLPPSPIFLLSNFCLLAAASTVSSSVQQLCESIVTCLIVFSFAVCGYYAQAAPPTPSLSLTPPPLILTPLVYSGASGNSCACARWSFRANRSRPALQHSSCSAKCECTPRAPLQSIFGTCPFLPFISLLFDDRPPPQQGSSPSPSYLPRSLSA